MALEDLLLDWLPRQRWYAAKDRNLAGVRVEWSRVLQADDPELRHLLIETNDGERTTLYQMFLGVRDELEQRLEHATLGALDDGRFVYDALHDHETAALLPRWIDANAIRENIAFHRVPGAPPDLAADGDPDVTSLVLNAEQSNTSVVYGEENLLKVFRIVVPGINPDLDITRALTDAGSPHIAPVRGWIDAEVRGVTTTLGLLQAFLRHGTEGWALAMTSVRDLFAEGDLHADEVGGDFAAEAERLGAATAEVHATMADILGVDSLGSDGVAGLADIMRQRLDTARGAVPALNAHAEAISDVYDDFAASAAPLPVQRVHGDYHLGQVLRTESGWVLLDFEGEPGAPIEERTVRSSPLRDVAGMLRSFDYVSRYLLIDQEEAPQLEYRATEWAERNRDAFCTGYAKAAGRDPRESGVVLRAFELDKAVYEVVYESRNRPSWMGIPLGSVERLAG